MKEIEFLVVQMLDNKGQAFSVFELMIAGVVAFAILIILLIVIGGININPYSDPKTVISNAIKSADPSGESTTQEFFLSKDESIDTSDLASETDLDVGALFFVMGQFKDTDPLEVGDAGEYVKYTGATQRKMAAKVICKQTAEALSSSLERLGSTYNFSEPPESCADSSTCCAIVLLKK